MRENTSDPKVLELAIIAISHAVRAVLLPVNEPPDSDVVKLIGLNDTLDVVSESIRYPGISSLAVTHVIPLLGSPTLHCWDIALKHPDLLNFLAACFRCEDLDVRCEAMVAFFHLHHHDAEEDATTFDPRRILERYESGAFNQPRIKHAMAVYGFQDTDTFNTVLASRDFSLAMLKVVKTGNIADLGRTLAGLVVQAEFSIRDGIYRTTDKWTGGMKVLYTGLPFERWVDALPHCVEALQETGHNSDIDMADILQIKYLMMMRKPQAAIPRARAAVERSPNVSYFYYTMALVTEMEGLRYARKGMKCKSNSKFLHFSMMKRAIELAGNLGISALGSKAAGGGKELFFDECHGGCQRFHRKCSPGFTSHARGRSLVHARDFNPQGSQAVHELGRFRGKRPQSQLCDSAHPPRSQPVLDKRDLGLEFLEIVGVTPFESQADLVLASLLKHMDKGNLEWGPPMMKVSQLLANKWNYKHKRNPVTKNIERRMDDLAAWLGKLDIEPGKTETTHCVNSKVDPKKVGLYRCTHCGTPSGVLRRCKCGKVR